MLKTIARWLLALGFILAGWNHFRDPPFYMAIIPPWLPRPDLLNIISGAAEMAGGLGILIVSMRRTAAWGLIALLIAVFPANIYMVMNNLAGKGIAPWLLWTRLPFQLVFIAWVYWSCLSHRSASGSR
jgi:uncharacterized membrane protein